MNDEYDNNQLTAEQFLQQHDFFVENVLKKLLKCIQHVYKNIDELFKARQHVALQQKKKVSLQDQEFIFEDIICFAFENVQIRFNLKQE